MKIEMSERSSTELDLIAKIGKRAVELTKSWSKRPRSSWVMDIDSWHMAEPLDLEKLLNFNNFNFLHDVTGIMKHLDRTTGKPDNRFLPRSSR